MFAKCEYVIIEVVYWAYYLYFQNKLYYSIFMYSYVTTGRVKSKNSNIW